MISFWGHIHDFFYDVTTKRETNGKNLVHRECMEANHDFILKRREYSMKESG
jgi:hypothetical protein